MQLHLNQFSGQREKNKIEKLQRIREAARELFVQKGFDETTTRQLLSGRGLELDSLYIRREQARSSVPGCQ